MPEFILPAEADHCPHCGKALYDPPNCCEAMQQEAAEFQKWADAEAAKDPPFPDVG